MMQVAFYLAGEIIQIKESIPWVRCASGNVSSTEERLNAKEMWRVDLVRGIAKQLV